MRSTYIIKICLFLITITLISSCKAPTNSFNREGAVDFYIGTYTSEQSEGIYKYALNPDGSMKKIGLAVESENPSFLVKYPSKPYILATNEVDIEGTSAIEIFHEYEDSLILLTRDLSFGAHACHISANKDGHVLTSNYSGGNVSLHKINNEGLLTIFLDTANHFGNGMHPRQDAPHAHWAEFDPFSEKIFVADLGTNHIWIYSLKQTDQKTTMVFNDKIVMADSAGPRCFAFHPSGKWVYVLNELNNTITRISRLEKEFLKAEESVTTLPVDFKDFNTSAFMEISKDGKFLYSSNRGHNTIAAFVINSESGELSLINHVSTRGTTPRHFALSPDGKYLLVANQNSNNLVCFNRNKETGKLSYASQIAAPNPTCILFNLRIF